MASSACAPLLARCVRSVALIFGFFEAKYEERLAKVIDVNSAAILTFNSSNRWLGVRVELLAAFVSSLIGLGFWLLRGQVAASFVGMCFIWNTTLLPHAGEDLPRFSRGVVMFFVEDLHVSSRRCEEFGHFPGFQLHLLLTGQVL